MKRLSKYNVFFESRKNESILEVFGILLESDEIAAPAQSQSEKEILDETPEDKKKKLEDILVKHFPEAKGQLDVDAVPNEEDKKEDEEVEKTNEGVVLLAITIASLVPLAMEAVGSLSNMLKQNFGINLDEKQTANLRKINEGITAYNKLLKDPKAKVKFSNKEYTRENWSEISNLIATMVGVPELAFGKGYDDDHGHHAKPEENVDTPATQSQAPIPEVTDQITREIAKLKSKRDKIFGTNFGKWMKDKGHALHQLYTSPIRLILRGIAKLSKKDSKLRDEATREKVANVIYAITMVGLSGYGIMSTLSHMNGVGEVAQIILKGIENGINTHEIRKKALTTILMLT